MLRRHLNAERKAIVVDYGGDTLRILVLTDRDGSRPSRLRVVTSQRTADLCPSGLCVLEIDILRCF